MLSDISKQQLFPSHRQVAAGFEKCAVLLLWTLQNAASFLMQISPLVFMVLLSLVSTLFISDPPYSLVPDSYVFVLHAISSLRQPVILTMLLVGWREGHPACKSSSQQLQLPKDYFCWSWPTLSNSGQKGRSSLNCDYKYGVSLVSTSLLGNKVNLLSCERIGKQNNDGDSRWWERYLVLKAELSLKMNYAQFQLTLQWQQERCPTHIGGRLSA